MIKTTTAAFALILALSAFVLAQSNSKNETAIKAVIAAMAKAQTEFDAKALDSIFTADFIEISPVGEFDPRAKVLSFYTSEAKAKSGVVEVSIEPIYRSIRVYGDTAVVIAEFVYSTSRDGKEMPARKMMMTAVGRKESGKWKLASVQYTGIRPAQLAAPKPQ
ncbi:MAG: nuclear transport factor 2 family protein [Pyrinomonadaceae bacterium]|nr:nuclear transport factor 2 family protein [Pyrinomonadaceae bacterium]